MSKFWRILSGLVIIIGLPTACCYEWYQAATHPHGFDNILMYSISTIVVVCFIIWKLYNNNKEE